MAFILHVWLSEMSETRVACNVLLRHLEFTIYGIFGRETLPVA